ncbi:MAG: hypothetical protein FWC68_02305 [Oscillospiraceae bacterium]|nr:hypothetical protein [Oscillospiraceae bacterium]
MEQIYDLLIAQIDKSKIKLNEPMSKHTSFRIGGPADMFVKVETVSELEYVLEVTAQNDVPLTVIRKWNKLISKRPEELEG